MRGPLMKPLRTPDMQRKRQHRQHQQQQPAQAPQSRGLSLKQQIEQQHQQQLVPWSSSQPANASGTTPPSSQFIGGGPPSSEIVPFELVAEQLLQSGGPVRRLRFNASRQAKSLVVAKLPERLRSLKQPICISKDVPVGVIDVLPVSEWLTFERTLATQQPSPEEIEQRSKAQASLEAALTQRAAGLRRGSDSDEETRRGAVQGTAASSSLFEDELGLERQASKLQSQKKKRLKGFLKDRGGKSAANEYIDSALSIGNLRQEAVTWDFEEGERSDDEGGEAPQDAKDNAADTLEAEPVDSETDDDPEDPLTSFGQKMKNLLEKARDEEADAELNQYASDDDDEEGAEEKVQDAQPATPGPTGGPPSDVGQRSVVSSASRGSQAAPLQQSVDFRISQLPEDTRETLEAKVVRVMQQHMGRMAVKDFMSAFKVKQKNEEFKRIQRGDEQVTSATRHVHRGPSHKIAAYPMPPGTNQQNFTPYKNPRGGKAGGPSVGPSVRSTPAAKTVPPVAAPGGLRPREGVPRRLGAAPVAAAANAPQADALPFRFCIAAVSAQTGAVASPRPPKGASERVETENQQQYIDCLEMLLDLADASQQRVDKTSHPPEIRSCRVVVALPEELFLYAKRQSVLSDTKARSFADLKPPDVARVVLALITEYGTAIRQEKANALAAATAAPASLYEQRTAEKLPEQDDSQSASLDLLLCLCGLSWCPGLLLALEATGMGLGVFIALTAANLADAAAALVAAEAEQFAAALKAAETEDSTVAAELISISDCNKQHADNPELLLLKLVDAAATICKQREEYRQFVGNVPLETFGALNREAPAPLEAEAPAASVLLPSSSPAKGPPAHQQQRQGARREGGEGAVHEREKPSKPAKAPEHKRPKLYNSLTGAADPDDTSVALLLHCMLQQAASDAGAKLALQCRAYAFFPGVPESHVEHLLQMHSFEGLLSAIAGGPPVGAPVWPSGEPLASRWCVRETIPADRFAQLLGAAIRSRDFAIDGRVLPRTGHLLLALTHRTGPSRGSVDVWKSAATFSRRGFREWRRYLGASNMPPGLRCLIDLPPERHGIPRTHEVYVHLGEHVTIIATTYATGIAVEPSCIAWASKEPQAPVARAPLKLPARRGSLAATASTSDRSAAATAAEDTATPPPVREWRSCRVMLPGACSQLLGGYRLVVRGLKPSVRRLTPQPKDLQSEDCTLIHKARLQAQQHRKEPPPQDQEQQVPLNQLPRQEQEEQPKERPTLETLMETWLETLVEVASPSGHLIQVTSDGSLWERHIHNSHQTCADAAEVAEDPSLQGEAGASAAISAPVETQDSVFLHQGSARIWFGCREDTEVHRRVHPCGAVIRETLTGRVEIFMPNGDYVSRVPLQSEFASRCASLGLPPALKSLGNLYNCLPPGFQKGLQDLKQLSLAVLGDPFGTGREDQGFPGHWLTCTSDGQRFGRFRHQPVALADAAKEAEDHVLSVLRTLLSLESGNVAGPTTTDQWMEYRLSPSLSASKRDIRRGLLFSFTNTSLRAISRLNIPQGREPRETHKEDKTVVFPDETQITTKHHRGIQSVLVEHPQRVRVFILLTPTPAANLTQLTAAKEPCCSASPAWGADSLLTSSAPATADGAAEVVAGKKAIDAYETEASFGNGTRIIIRKAPGANPTVEVNQQRGASFKVDDSAQVVVRPPETSLTEGLQAHPTFVAVVIADDLLLQCNSVSVVFSLLTGELRGLKGDEELCIVGQFKFLRQETEAEAGAYWEGPWPFEEEGSSTSWRFPQHDWMKTEGSPEAVTTVRTFRLFPPFGSHEVRQFERNYAAYQTWEGMNSGLLHHLLPVEERSKPSDAQKSYYTTFRQLDPMCKPEKLSRTAALWGERGFLAARASVVSRGSLAALPGRMQAELSALNIMLFHVFMIGSASPTTAEHFVEDDRSPQPSTSQRITSNDGGFEAVQPTPAVFKLHGASTRAVSAAAARAACARRTALAKAANAEEKLRVKELDGQWAAPLDEEHKAATPPTGMASVKAAGAATEEMTGAVILGETLAAAASQALSLTERHRKVRVRQESASNEIWEICSSARRPQGPQDAFSLRQDSQRKPSPERQESLGRRALTASTAPEAQKGLTASGPPCGLKGGLEVMPQLIDFGVVSVGSSTLCRVSARLLGTEGSRVTAKIEALNGPPGVSVDVAESTPGQVAAGLKWKGAVRLKTALSPSNKAMGTMPSLLTAVLSIATQRHVACVPIRALISEETAPHRNAREDVLPCEWGIGPSQSEP
ncbi:hypothetical protein cyc_07010 [Cyclospora cayetanensis]|uniref:Uncharacterized protein n=1 Tax=Cyclospora cayetanensis TaxID=88456 RepID=A0A1D3CY45_9EIME|nr:hypothetical protein cyc_07010 [Cyclospora cayetanensis]